MLQSNIIDQLMNIPLESEFVQTQMFYNTLMYWIVFALIALLCLRVFVGIILTLKKIFSRNAKMVKSASDNYSSY